MVVALRVAVPQDDEVVIDHYLAIWASYGVPREDFARDARASTRRFLDASRAHWQGEVVLAEEDGRVLGSTSYQLQIPPYPEVLRTDVRRVGYIWSVFVEPAARGDGVARAMVSFAVDRLETIGCTMIALHASDAGAPLYERLGFALAKEMRLKLR